MIALSVPLRYRPIAFAIGAGIEEFLATLAPFLGGVITDKLSWRCCFYISLPLGFITLLVVGLFFETDAANPHHTLPFRQKIAKLDLVGTAILIPSIVSLLPALQFGGTKFGWNDSRIIIMLVLFILLIAGFVWYQWHGMDSATFPPRIVMQRSVRDPTL